MSTEDRREILARAQALLERAAEFERQHAELLTHLMAIGNMPLDTDENKLARYTRKVEVVTALADLYEAKRAEMPPGELFSWVLLQAESKYRQDADVARASVVRVRARVDKAAVGGDR